MNWIQQIKAPKTLSSNHWRFRIIEAIFPKPMIPRYIYQQYCPLFHLSNLLFLFTFILPIIPIIFVIAKVTHFCLDIFSWLIDKIDSKFKIRETIENNSEAAAIAALRAAYFKYPRFIDEQASCTSQADFAEVLSNYYVYTYSIDSYYSDLSALINDQTKLAMLVKEVGEWRAEREAREAIQASNSDDMLTLIRISSILVKSIFVCLAIALLFCAAYLTVFFVMPITWKIFLWALTIDWIQIIVLAIKITVPILILTLSLFFTRAIWLPALKTPFSIFVDALASGLDFIKALSSSAIEFVSMFYSDNCPKVVITDEKTKERGAAND